MLIKVIVGQSMDYAKEVHNAIPRSLRTPRGEKVLKELIMHFKKEKSKKPHSPVKKPPKKKKRSSIPQEGGITSCINHTYHYNEIKQRVTEEPFPDFLYKPLLR